MIHSRKRLVVLYNDEEAMIVIALLLIKYVILRQTISRTGVDKEPETLLAQVVLE